MKLGVIFHPDLWSLASDISTLKQASPSEKPVTQYGFNWEDLWDERLYFLKGPVAFSKI